MTSPSLADTLWPLAAKIPAPENIWEGRRITDGLAVDNLLIFPHQQRPGPPHGEHFGTYHPRFVLDTVVDRPVRFHAGGYDHELHPGEMLLIFPHQFHHARRAEEPGRWVVVTFELCHPGEIAQLRDAPRQAGPEGIELLSRLITAYRDGAAGVAISYLATSLLLHLVHSPELPPERTRLPSPEPERDAFFARVEEHLERDNLTSPAELARAMGASEPQLRALFRRYTMRSPADFIRRNRLARAARMLQQGEANVTGIASRLGFSSLHAFSRMFKTVYGLSPKQYEKKST